ncbi:MAG: acyl-CoA thioesterase [Candidatus Promineifilaceae bacterium]|nr:acyl-CoA thioesterase [Candidatus Promineifilaceae bacterium]
MAKLEIVARPADCDSYGHVNNAVFASYFEAALAQTFADLGFEGEWQPDGPVAWQPLSLHLEYRQPATSRQRLTARVWATAYSLTGATAAAEPTFYSEITRPDENDDVVSILRASGRWQRRRVHDGEPLLPPDGLLAAFRAQTNGHRPRDFDLPPDDPAVRRYQWCHQVEIGEVNPQRRAHIQSVYQWLQAGVYHASAEAGWPQARWREVGFGVVQTRHDTQFKAWPYLDEELEVVSCLAEVRRWRGTWLQEVRRRHDGTLLLRNYSTGVFLNEEGRPGEPPAELFEDIRG